MSAGTARPKYSFHLPMEYTDGNDLRILHEDIAVDGHRHLKIVGHPDWGSYEWVIEDEDSLTFSNSGYGIADIALRDGLIVFHGDYGTDECLAPKIAQLLKTSKTVRRLTVTPIRPRGAK